MEIKSIEIRKLEIKDSSVIADALQNEDSEYLKHFIPFEFTLQSITEILSNAERDKFFGLFVKDDLVGFYMLRGLDEGYETPSYGVWISSKYSNKGLSKLTLYHAFSICKLNDIKKIMLKVHPENKIAKSLYESLGFEQTGFDDKINNYIYNKTVIK